MPKLFFISFLSFQMFSYIEVPMKIISADSVDLSRSKGIQLHHNLPFSGYLISHRENGSIMKSEGFLKGKREGIFKVWDDKGQVIENRSFANNLRTGSHFGYFSSGQKKFEYDFKNDLPIGTHKEWLENGQLFSISNYNDQGQIEGEQKRYYASGKIRANFVIKNGRRYGFLGAKGCMGENEKENFNLALVK